MRAELLLLLCKFSALLPICCAEDVLSDVSVTLAEADLRPNPLK
jgi:hypothetical protein